MDIGTTHKTAKDMNTDFDTMLILANLLKSIVLVIATNLLGVLILYLFFRSWFLFYTGLWLDDNTLSGDNFFQWQNIVKTGFLITNYSFGLIVSLLIIHHSLLKNKSFKKQLIISVCFFVILMFVPLPIITTGVLAEFINIQSLGLITYALHLFSLSLGILVLLYINKGNKAV